MFAVEKSASTRRIVVLDLCLLNVGLLVFGFIITYCTKIHVPLTFIIVKDVTVSDD